MRQLSSSGQQAVNDIAQRHGFSSQAVETMLQAVINGNGSMAQFNHAEFGGSGQWMSGGMTMIGDMFNSYLKGRVDSLCSELAQLVRQQPDLMHSGSGSDTGNSNNLFAPAPPDWWGADLRWPNSTGGQNNMRYAYFAQARRLAIDIAGMVTVYDTLDHQIGGVSQQNGNSVSFSSQNGYVDLSQLPVISVNGVAPVINTPAPAPFVPANTSTNNGGDIFASIEKLSALQAKGILTQQEFAAKKAELLSRL